MKPSGNPLSRSYRANASNGLVRMTPPKSNKAARINKSPHSHASWVRSVDGARILRMCRQPWLTGKIRSRARPSSHDETVDHRGHRSWFGTSTPNRHGSA
jgi:hypothetical protein